tara:strand:+ start:2480 stop:3118 length:639 start_codon:yes stop_codon:yes gene_type:complete
MLCKIIAKNGDYNVFNGFDYDVLLPQSMHITHDLRDHVVIWSGSSQTLDENIPVILSVLNQSGRIMSVTNSCQTFFQHQAFSSRLHQHYNDLNKFFSRLDDFDQLMTQRDDLQHQLMAFQAQLYQCFKQGSIIHVYDCDVVNADMATPPVDLNQTFSYQKFTLFSSALLSAYLYYPTHQIAITPLHSHHTRRCLISTYRLYEWSISAPLKCA